jgi:dienelactone hydrolase
VPGQDGQLVDRSSEPQVQGDAPHWRQWSGAARVLLLIPEGRGYGGSEGPKIGDVLGKEAETLAFLERRARDASAAAEWVTQRPDADGSRVLIAGQSHGGVVSLLASALRSYAGTAIQATGPFYRRPDAGISSLLTAAAQGTGPLLIQHMRTDTLVSSKVSSAIHEAARTAGRESDLRLYPGAPRVEGHFLHHPDHVGQWMPDFRAFQHRCLHPGAASAAR